VCTSNKAGAANDTAAAVITASSVCFACRCCASLLAQGVTVHTALWHGCYCCVIDSCISNQPCTTLHSEAIDSCNTAVCSDTTAFSPFSSAASVSCSSSSSSMYSSTTSSCCCCYCCCYRSGLGDTSRCPNGSTFVALLLPLALLALLSCCIDSACSSWPSTAATTIHSSSVVAVQVAVDDANLCAAANDGTRCLHFSHLLSNWHPL
jgi:hypothetical protein